jgi:hypothetical protein
VFTKLQRTKGTDFTDLFIQQTKYRLVMKEVPVNSVYNDWALKVIGMNRKESSTKISNRKY